MKAIVQDRYGKPEAVLGLQEIAKPAVKEQMQKHGFIPRSSTPEWLATYMKDQLAVWKVALKDAGIEPQ